MVKITCRFNSVLYNRLKEYADQNGFPSIISAIRYILIKFFKENT